MASRLQQIYKLKMVIVALLALVAGIALQMLAKYASLSGDLSWLGFLPLSEIGATLFAAGLFGIVWDYFDGKDKEARENERIRRLLRESAPWMRDAVLRGFALHPDDLERVATPKLLDQLAENALALRLGDRQFASEIYADVRDQAIRAPERWYDVSVNVRLSAAAERSTTGTPLFDILVEWEYTTTPSHRLRKFACVSDRDEFYELVTEVPSTSTWFIPPRTGVDASDRLAFELLEFAVDGESRPIRRRSRSTGQTYSVLLGDAAHAAEPVSLRYVYRTVGAQDAHRLFLELPVPAKNVACSVDYTATDIAYMAVTEAVTSLARPRVTQLGDELPGREIKVELPGWLLPRSGLTFVWTLKTEQTSSEQAHAVGAASASPTGSPAARLSKSRRS